MRLTRLRPGLVLAACLAAAAVLAATLLSGQTSADATIRLRPDQTFQTITGWEATASLPNNPAAPEWAPYHDTQILRAVRDAGIDRIRLEFRSNTENDDPSFARYFKGQIPEAAWSKLIYQVRNDNDDPHVINWSGFDFSEVDWYMDNTVMPLRKALAAEGRKLFINACYVAFKGGRTFQRDPEEYAEFVLAAYVHLKDKYGIVPDSWEMILEPDVPKDGWTGTEIGQAMVATARRLEGAGFTPAFVAPSVTDISNTLPYVDAIVAVPGAAKYLREISYHRYRNKGKAKIADIAARARALGVNTSMLELWFGKANYDVLFQDLKVGNVSAWQGRVLEGLYVPQPDGTIGPNPEVRYNALVMRAVRAGALRIGADSDNPQRFDALAFVNPDDGAGSGPGDWAVAVRARQGGTVRIEGLPPGRYQVSYAIPAGSQELPAATDASGALEATIPDKGILTIARPGK
ncbi:MAG: hypothetical protein JSR87_05035 [Proteobacteria bacterium]|nr:hypothetical protein [Pseudomonadota bacterium]MBS0574471.1 hypothetical protein [Pseudomonadota bacterium]